MTKFRKKWYQTNRAKYALAGAFFGFCFPIIAMGIDFIRLGLALNWGNLVQVQLEYPIHLIINTAPIFLGLFAFIGGARQDKISELNQELRNQINQQENELTGSKASLAKTLARTKRMESELNIATSIQMSMLQDQFPVYQDRENIDVYARLIPAREVGGDFYDFDFIDEDHFYFSVGDVSGKGVPAALMMAVCKTLLKSKAQVYRSTAKVLTEVNNQMAAENSNYMFVTVFIAILNIKTGELVFSNAGHSPTFIQHPNGELSRLADLHGPVIAAMENLRYKEDRIQLDAGAKILAYTDGVTEAHNMKDELYAEERLIQVLKKSAKYNPKKIVEDLITSVLMFQAGREAFDDVTGLVVSYDK